jgi:glutaminyl-peptide cyclotransferase
MPLAKNNAAFLAVATLVVFSCSPKKNEEHIIVPLFNADSAYNYVKAQVDFGPRVPGSASHREAAAFLVQELKRRGAVVTVQKFNAVTFDGVNLELSNIIAGFQPEKQKRVLLAAHWDTRPFADKDKERRDAPMDGANDGASGVGVLLEIARTLQSSPTKVGVDIILFDGEDWGEKDGAARVAPPTGTYIDWYCLGSQYWSKNKHKAGYRPYYGILLDMVGGEDGHFYMEETSMQYASQIVQKVWTAAARAGYSSYFVTQDAPAITDDHVFVLMSGIPMIDVVHYDVHYGYFGKYHHTTADNMDNISKKTLNAVGNTVMEVIYREP